MSKSIAEQRIETQLIFNRLADAQPGDTISYQELTDAGGIDVTGDGRGLLHTARNKAENELHCLFSTVRNVGLRRCLPDENPGELEDANKRVRKAARKLIRRSGRVIIEDMTQPARLQFAAQVTIANVVAHVTSDKTSKRIAAAVTEAGHALPLSKTLEHFGK